jgi:murein L,D-transpeptidase YcbB/YkuD
MSLALIRAMRLTRGIVMLILVAAAAAACERRAASLSPAAEAIRTRVAAASSGDAGSVAAQVGRFYGGRQYAPAWHDGKGRASRAPLAISILQQADEHGLAQGEYRPRSLVDAVQQATQVKKPDIERDAGAIADLDVRLTTAVLTLARDVAIGRVEPSVMDARWNQRRALPDLAAALQSALEREAATFLDRVQPVHPEYAALKKSLAALRAQREPGWPSVPRVAARRGLPPTVIATLRQRLAAEGYLAAGDGAAVMDEDAVAGLRRFQEHHALPPSGALDPATLAAMNVPLETRIAQVATNLERWRWLPDDLGARHFIVNIPYFHLIARERGEPVMDIRVVVGKQGNETPTFSDEMKEVVFSPYWNIPETIALEETAPAVARDPDYLARNNMEVVTASGKVVPESAIPWDDPDALSRLSFRQRPGANNALGYVKFLFPNKYNVYLHDTPADALFKRIGRAFSHGCVRVEEPEALASYVLRDQPEWTADAILAAMRAGEEKHVALKAPIPVHIVYFTAWVDAAGGLHFQPDVYGYDARQASRRGAGSRDTG